MVGSSSGPRSLPAIRPAPAVAVRSSTEVATRTRGELPLLAAEDPDRVVGLVPLVRLLGGVSGVLGALAIAASAAMGHVLLTIIAAAMTALILIALWEDTRLANALEQWRRKNFETAEASLALIAGSSRRSPWQRQRARTFLAALAWRRGDVDLALSWVEARLAGPRRGRVDRWQEWLAEATRVKLLALCGRAEDARSALASLGSPPPERYARRVAAEIGLWVAFASDAPQRAREDVDRWAQWIEEDLDDNTSDSGAAHALLAWAYAGLGRRDRALAMAAAVRAGQAEGGALARHYPRLWQWLVHYGAGVSPGRE